MELLTGLLSPMSLTGARIELMRKFFMMLTMICFTAGISPGATLKIRLTGQSHASGLYHNGNQTVLHLRIKNTGNSPQVLSGTLTWNLRRGPGNNMALLATTPIRPTMLVGGQSVRIALPETFAGVGIYHLCRHGIEINGNKNYQPMRCIYSPIAGVSAANSPWIQPVPSAFFRPHAVGLIGNYVHETGIYHYLLNADFAREGSVNMMAACLQIAGSLKKAGADLIPVFTIQQFPQRRENRLNGINEYELFQFLKPLITDCRAIVVRYSSSARLATPGVAAVQTMIGSLHAALQALKSSALIFATPDVIGAGRGNVAFSEIIGGVALSDSAHSMRLCHALDQSDGALPVMILPAEHSSSRPAIVNAAPDPAVFLVSAAAYVPVRVGMDNFEVHVLGAGKLFSIVHPKLPLLAAVFAQPYGSVAVIAGLGAGSRGDKKFNAWKSRPPVMMRGKMWHQLRGIASVGFHRLSALMPQPGQFPRGKIIVVDTEGLMATRSSSGISIPTPYPGWQEIPLNHHVFFLTYPGKPDDLAAALRTAEIKGLPLACVTAGSQSIHSKERTFTLLIHNARVGRLQGTISLAVAPMAGKVHGGDIKIGPAVHFGPIHGGDSAAVTLSLPHPVMYHSGSQLQAILHWRRWVELTPLGTLEAASPPSGRGRNIIPAPDAIR